MLASALLLVALAAPEETWIRRLAPEKNMIEAGVYGGLIFPAADLELFDSDRSKPNFGFLRFKSVGPEVGGRVGYYPIRYFGVEAEGGYAPVGLRDYGVTTSMWALRGHVVGQLGWWSVTPFVLLGAGVLSVASSDAAVGNDVDQALHLGFGSKFFVHRYVMARLELRDVITPRRGVAAGATNTLEVLLGLSVTLGRGKDQPRPEPDPEPEDRDGDGVGDAADECPDDPGIEPTGCPDRDEDTILDRDDVCPDDPGAPPSGCPDQDGDGFLDKDDACPEAAGIAPDGCPDDDPDKDGIKGDTDACPDEAETFNGFEDDDGCPDAVPEELDAFNGTIGGIEFELGKAALRKSSLPTLDKAVEILGKHQSVRVEISGHTDSTGKRESNEVLSLRRAEAVKAYLVDRGITQDRIETRGAGADEPIDTNKTKQGRARNRRIEFRLLE